MRRRTRVDVFLVTRAAPRAPGVSCRRRALVCPRSPAGSATAPHPQRVWRSGARLRRCCGVVFGADQHQVTSRTETSPVLPATGIRARLFATPAVSGKVVWVLDSWAGRFGLTQHPAICHSRYALLAKRHACFARFPQGRRSEKNSPETAPPARGESCCSSRDTTQRCRQERGVCFFPFLPLSGNEEKAEED